MLSKRTERFNLSGLLDLNSRTGVAFFGDKRATRLDQDTLRVTVALRPIPKNTHVAGKSFASVKCDVTGVSPEFLGLPAERQLQLQAGGRRFWRSEDSLRQNLPDSVRQRVEPEGWNPEESLRDDQQLLAQNP